MRIQALRRDCVQILRLSDAGHTVGLSGAHGPQQLRVRVAALVVDAREHGVEQILLFALHNASRKRAVFQPRRKQQLGEKLHQGRENRLLHVLILHIVAVKADQLHLALFADQRSDARAVQLVEFCGNRGDVRVLHAAAQQDARNERVCRSLFLFHRPQQVQTEAAGLEFVGLHRRQIHAGQNLGSMVHTIHPYPFHSCVTSYHTMRKK